MQMPSIENENSDRNWKKRWKRPRRWRCSWFGQVDFVVDVILELIAHVADGVDVDARGDERDHAEHGDGERIDVVADREAEFAELAEGVPIAGEAGWWGVGTGGGAFGFGGLGLRGV